ncbi:hypothetical protein B6D29_03720 [Microgenomates bacterium UTCPR1]|nr:MAG: hypothetical protein B6D29_03720 [Microgenomates bacterium UTCPR1]
MAKRGKVRKMVIPDIEVVREGKKGPKGGMLGGENDPYKWLKLLAIRSGVDADHYRKVFGEEPEVKGGNNQEKK